MGVQMNKYLKLHIDTASRTLRRRFNIARIVVKLIAMVILAYAVMFSLWWCATVLFAATGVM